MPEEEEYEDQDEYEDEEGKMEDDEGEDQEEMYGQESGNSQDHPQDQEIEDYAKFLGMDPNSSIDHALMFIAKQGLMEPVPEPWEA